MMRKSFIISVISILLLCLTAFLPLCVAGAVEAGAITDVNVTLTFPTAGQHPNYTASLSNNLCSFAPTQLGTGNNGKNIRFSLLRSDSTPLILDSSSTFSYGSTYRIDMYLSANSGYFFEPAGMTIFTINGYSAVVDSLSDELCKIHIDYMVGTGVVGLQVGTVNISVTPPVAGHHPGYSYTIDGDGCSLSGAPFGSANAGMPFWITQLRDGMSPLILGSSSTYQEGETYRFDFYLVADGGYSFTDDSHVTRIFVNNEYSEFIGCDSAYYYCYVEYTAEAPSGYTMGDVDGDGDVDNTDAVLLKRYAMNWAGSADKIKNMAAADLNGDSKADNTDAILLKRCVMNWTGYREQYCKVVTG